jgi:hypothetical protein
MINWLKEVILSRVYTKTIKNTVVPDNIRSSKDLKNISIILDHSLGIDKERFKEIGTYFNIPRKNIRVLTFFQSPKQIEESNEGSSCLPKNISCFGILSGILPDFCNHGSDVLINFYDQDDINMKYVSAKTKKKISIGFKSVDNALNDLIIDVDAQNIDIFVNECIKYLKIFFKNKK